MQVFEFVRTPDDVRHRRIAEHASARRQHRAQKAQHLAVAQAQIHRLRMSGLHQRDAFGDIGCELGLRQLIGTRVAPVIHQRHEGGPGVGLLVRQSPHLAERTIDELRAHLGIEQHHAERHMVERRAQLQQFAAHQLAAAPGGLGLGEYGNERRAVARPRVRRRGRMACRVERHADAIAGGPSLRALPGDDLAVELQFEVGGNSDRAGHLDAGAAVGKIANGTIDRGAALMKQDLAPFQGAATRFRSSFRHQGARCKSTKYRGQARCVVVNGRLRDDGFTSRCVCDAYQAVNRDTSFS